MKNLILILLSVSSILNTFAQILPGTYKTTWAGNSYSGKTDWVQGYMLSGTVTPEGKVITIAHWDEAGKTCGIYKDGKTAGKLPASGFAVTSNELQVFTQDGTGVKRFNAANSLISRIELGFTPTYLAANKTYLVASDNPGNKVAVFRLSNGSVLKQWSIINPGAVAIDTNNLVWIVSGVRLPEERFERKWLVYDSAYVPRIYCYNHLGEAKGDSILLYPQWRPVCLAIDRNTNQLMVGDDGPKHQIHFFTSDTLPAFKKSFGDEGGIGSGEPGISTSAKFWALKGIGTDQKGNIYTVLSEDGSIIRSLTPEGQLNWELIAANFVDGMNFDQYSDGKYLYGKNEIIEMDYSKTTPGEEWKFYAYTQDRTAFPNDPRNFYTSLGHDFTSVWPRFIEGEPYLFTAGMYDVKPHVFKFNGKLASPAAYLRLTGSRAFFQDKEGNYWQATSNGIVRTKLVTVEKNGDLVYGKTEKTSSVPSPLSVINRIMYDEENDIMYLTDSDNKIARYNNWSNGNRIAAYAKSLPQDYNQCVAAAGDYIFSCGVQTRARIKVFRASDFAYMGMLEAGAEVGYPENTGWVDIPYGLNAMKRSNGEYIIAIEDDGRMKNIIFRWCPDGSCLQNPPEVKFEGIRNKSRCLPGDSLVFSVQATDPNGVVDSIHIYNYNTLLASTAGDKFSFTWRNIPQGKHYLIAKAFDNDGLWSTTYPLRIYTGYPDTTAPETPLNLTVQEITATYAVLSWNKSDDDKLVAGYKILRNGVVTYTSGGPDTLYKATGLLPGTEYNFSVITFDVDLNLSDTSDIVFVTTGSDGPYLGVPFTIPGRIEAEHFDKGGEGIAYHDSQPEHTGSAFRSDEGVDIGTTSNGYYVGWNEIGEWLRFTVNVERDGYYDLLFLTAGGSGSLEFRFSNGNKVYTAVYEKTSDWNVWKTAVKTKIYLLEGIQYLIVRYNNQQFNLDYLIFLDHQEENLQTPSNLRIDGISGNTATLRWEPTGNATNIREYKVYKDNKYLVSTTSNTYTSTNLLRGQSYDFSISSVSLTGIESGRSNSVTVLLELTGLEQPESGEKTVIFPNPLQNSDLTINSSGGDICITIINSAGQIILLERTSETSYKIPETCFKPGVYTVLLSNENKSQQIKLIVP